MKISKYDIVIAGGGMVGASLACALAKENVNIALVEAVHPSANNQPSYDDRGLALSISSQRILSVLGIWPRLIANANPVKRIHVSDQGHFGFVRLHADMLNLSALGYVVIARELGQVLMSRIKKADNIDIICPAEVVKVKYEQDSIRLTLEKDEVSHVLSASLLVAADGTHSKIREQLGIEVHVKSYQQTAIVSNITPEYPHEDTAYERFTSTGPLALLPLTQQRCAVVYTVKSEQAEECLKLEDDAFLLAMQKRFGRRLGRFTKIGSRKSYPLILIEPKQQVVNRVVLLGNSAHTIHPNGAQGFNLCLRDVAGLAEQLVPAIRRGDDIGSQQLLDAYELARRPDQQRVIRFSDRLARLFYNHELPKVITRNTGMLITDLISPVKHTFISRVLGIHGRQPGMVRAF